MSNEPEKSYPELANLTEDALDPNSSYSKILDLIEEPSRVLDVGCASGYMARLLTARGSRVWGIDINHQQVEAARQFCVEARVANLDTESIASLFPENSFDVIIFADVLEHLRNPWQVLDDARRLLGYKGRAIVSIPNIAHGAIRLGLLKGHFDYSEFGILDNTHLRFFTRRTVDELFVRCGYEVERSEKTILPLFAPSNLVPEANPADVDPLTLAKIRQDEDHETLQFVVRARALDDAGKLALVTERFLGANAKLETALESELSGMAHKQLLEARGALEIALCAARDENAHLKADLATIVAESRARAESIEQLREERTQFRQLQQREAELQLALADLSTSIGASVISLEARLTASNKELRHQREAFDEVYGQLAAARHISERAKQILSLDAVIARNRELSTAFESLMHSTRHYRALRQSFLWRAGRFARRLLVRIRLRLQAPKPVSSR